MLCRSREGAWIEMPIVYMTFILSSVAPVRERGLKLDFYWPSFAHLGVAPVRERGLKF